MPPCIFKNLMGLWKLHRIKVQEERIRRMQTEMEENYRAPTELESDSRGDPGSTHLTLNTLAHVYISIIYIYVYDCICIHTYIFAT